MHPLQRLPDWPERLAATIAAHRDTPFQWGVHDCALWACNTVQCLTGTDIVADLRGAWHTASEALRVLQGGGGLLAMISARLPERAPRGMARRGDVVCVAIDGRPTLGVVAGNGRWCAPGAAGMLFRPMAEVVHVRAV